MGGGQSDHSALRGSNRGHVFLNAPLSGSHFNTFSPGSLKERERERENQLYLCLTFRPTVRANAVPSAPHLHSLRPIVLARPGEKLHELGGRMLLNDRPAQAQPFLALLGVGVRLRGIVFYAPVQESS